MRTIKPFFIVLLLLPLMACDDLKELIEQEIDVPITFTLTIQLAVPEDANADAQNTFDSAATYDVLANPDVADAVGSPDQVKRIRFSSVRYSYKNATGNVDAEVSGRFQFIAADNSFGNFTTPPRNVIQASLTTERFDLGADISTIDISLNNDATVFARYLGDSTHNPIVFETELIINAIVTVKVNADDL